MDFLRQQFVLVQERLAGLSGSQKMLAAALVVIMAMTMLYWGKFASTQDRVAIFTSPVNNEQLAAAGTALGAAGIEFDSVGGQIRVASDRRAEAFSVASFALEGAIPVADGQSPLDAMFDKLQPWSSQGEVKARIGGARVEQLTRMMMMWPGVKKVMLQINESSTGQLVPPPSGVSIGIATKAGANPAKLAKAALAMVIPIVPGLTAQQVTVNIDGNPIIAAGSGLDGSTASSELIELKAQYEASARASIISAYNNISGLAVEVTADVNADRKESTINTVDPKQKISLPVENVNEETTTTEAAPIAEPGAVPNTGLDATALASAPRAGSKTKHSEERNENAWGKTEVKVSSPAGTGKILSAIVRVPRQYFVNEWKGRNSGEPKSDELQAFVTANLETMRSDIAHKLLIADLENVSVRDTSVTYEDPMKLLGDTAVATSTGSTLSLLAGSHGKEVAIGALALTSLFMVGRMVKKSSPTAVAPLLTLDDMPDVSAGKKGRKSTSFGGVEIAGEVGEGGQIMMGQELDEEVLETAQMVEQVSGFVKDNPDMTAQLLKRWMSRE